MSEAEVSSTTPQNILAEIQKGLDHARAEERLKSIEMMSTLTYSSKAILSQLEKMAFKDRSVAVRVAALSVLRMPLHRQIRARNTHLLLRTRQIIADEIIQWGKDGLLNEVQTETLHERYAFDFVPAPVEQETVSAELETDPSEPKATFSQTIFSETSIKIALYLGAFFVIAAAMIFAVAIEELRLPILLFFTLLFGGGSISIKKKLPQPSFTLFIVFSVLLPIDFSALADLLNFDAFATSLYWTLVFALTAAIWIFATWFFHSRFFSLTAFVSLGTSLLFFADTFNDPPIDLYLLMLSMTGLVGLAGVKFLQKWKDERF